MDDVHLHLSSAKNSRRKTEVLVTLGYESRSFGFTVECPTTWAATTAKWCLVPFSDHSKRHFKLIFSAVETWIELMTFHFISTMQIFVSKWLCRKILIFATNSIVLINRRHRNFSLKQIFWTLQQLSVHNGTTLTCFFIFIFYIRSTNFVPSWRCDFIRGVFL